VIGAWSVVILLFVIVANGASLQVLPKPTADELINLLKGESLAPAASYALADMGATQAVPIMREKFSALVIRDTENELMPSDQLIEKLALASALVRWVRRTNSSSNYCSNRGLPRQIAMRLGQWYLVQTDR
jgi:hypothetical protein